MLIGCQDLVVGYGGRGILPPVTLSVAPGDFWAVIGPNGAGKSTLMRTLLGILRPISGRVETHPELRLAYLQQRQQLDLIFPLRACDVVAGGALRGWSALNPFAAPRRKQIVAALERAGIAHHADTPFAHLSEGQKQRVLIAKGLIASPQVMLLDEPTSAMDATAEMEILSLINDLRKADRLALMVITHFMEVAPRFATHVCFVDNICGSVLIGDAHSVYTSPAFISHFGDHHHLLCGAHDEHGQHKEAC